MIFHSSPAAHRLLVPLLFTPSFPVYPFITPCLPEI
jgi:hypothetical protein